MLAKISEPPSVSRPRPRPLPRKPKAPDASQSVLVQITTPKLTPAETAIRVASDSEGSELTPLPSPLEAKDASATQVSSKKPDSQLGLNSSVPVTPRRRAPPHLVDLDPWKVENLGTYVWVLLDRGARVLEPEDVEDPEQCNKERLWWPGRIASKSSKADPLKVRLFGNVPVNVKTIEIHSPCQLNIVSLKDSNQRDRFTTPTFISSVALEHGLVASPRKKSKYDRADVEERWRIAVTELVQEREDAEQSDSLPEVGTLEFTSILCAPSPTKSTQGSPRKDNRKGKGQKRKRNEYDEEDDMEVDELSPAAKRWSPAPEDDTLQIPGELILAIEKGGDTEFWPARILAYLPPKRPRKEGKYRVEFLDTTKKDILRSWFYSSNDEEFGACRLGQWESEYNEVVNDEDNENVVGDIVTRSLSPLPRTPAPPPQEFYELSVREQFSYTKPILKAILNAEYAPAKQRHDLFIGGGDGRDTVKKDAGLRGRMDPEDVGMLGEYLTEWCLRDEKRAKILMEDIEDEVMDQSQHEDTSQNEKKARADRALVITVDEPFGDERSKTRSPSPAGTESPALSQGEIPPSSSFCPSEGFGPPPTDASCLSSAPNSPQSTNLHHDYIPPPRQHGCEEYEALSGEEKVSYCLNVLLPEAVLQILLWCNGLRTSVDILTEDEEMVLHDRGVDLLKERDWVNDVKRLRETARSLLKLGEEGKGGLVEVGGEWTFTGRPKRSAVKTISYRE